MKLGLNVEYFLTFVLYFTHLYRMKCVFTWTLLVVVCPSSRSADSPEVDHEGHGSSAADRPAALFCDPHVCHNRPGVLQRQTAPHLQTTARNTWYTHTHCLCLCSTRVHAAYYTVIVVHSGSKIFPSSVSHGQNRDLRWLLLFWFFIHLKPRSNLNCIAKQEIVSAPPTHTDGMDKTKESNL